MARDGVVRIAAHLTSTRNMLELPGGHSFKESENGKSPTNKVITCENCGDRFFYSQAVKSWRIWGNNGSYNGSPSCAFGIMDRVLE